MYGLVNNSLKEFVIQKFNEDFWSQVILNSDVEVDFFLNTEPYSDELTFGMVGNAVALSGMDFGVFLNEFGEFWILQTANKHYGSMMKTLGDNPKDFFINLVEFHNKVQLIYPKLQPPIFEVSDVKDNSLTLHYKSTRKGLTEFVVGLISGVGKLLNKQITTEKHHIEDDNHYDIFNLTWS